MNDTGESSQTTPAVFQYQYVKDPEFAAGLAGRAWEADEAYGGLVLQGSCPACKHGNAIDVFVPTQVVAFRSGTRVPPELVECRCSENHNQPPGKSGCGRWALISPHVAGQG